MKTLVLDSNSILSPDSFKLLNPHVESRLAECRTLEAIQVFLPRTVLVEVSYKKAVVLEKALNDWKTSGSHVANFSKIIPSSQNITTEQLKINLYRKYLNWCKLNKVSIEPTPINTIDWKRLITNSLYRKAPFSDGKSEKGFRDALILESFVVIAKKFPDQEITLITGDKRLTEAAKERVACEVVEDIDAFLSILNLRHWHVTSARLEIFTTKASRIFFEENNPTCLFEKTGILPLIRKQYEKALKAFPEVSVFDTIEFYPNFLTFVQIGSEKVSVGSSMYSRRSLHSVPPAVTSKGTTLGLMFSNWL